MRRTQISFAADAALNGSQFAYAGRRGVVSMDVRGIIPQTGCGAQCGGAICTIDCPAGSVAECICVQSPGGYQGWGGQRTPRCRSPARFTDVSASCRSRSNAMRANSSLKGAGAMSTPRFAAEASVYRTIQRYTTTGSGVATTRVGLHPATDWPDGNGTCYTTYDDCSGQNVKAEKAEKCCKELNGKSWKSNASSHCYKCKGFQP